MIKPDRSEIRRRLGHRPWVAAAAAVGFSVGAAGLVAANQPSGSDDTSTTVADTVADDTPTTVADTVADTIADDTPTTVADTVADTIADATPTSIDLTIPDDSVVTAPVDTVTDDTAASDDATSTTIDDDRDDATSTTTDDDRDDATSTTIDDDRDDATSTTTDDDRDDATSTTIDDDRGDELPTLPGPFTETYAAAGGSITVSWTGTSLSLESISPAPGFGAEIEQVEWDRVRVDFESGDDDHRIEVRISDGGVRVRID